MRAFFRRKYFGSPEEESNHFPLDVQTRVVVIVPATIHHTESRENHRGFQRGIWAKLIAARDVVDSPLQGLGLAVLQQAKFARLGHHLNLAQRHRLQVSPADPRGLEPGGLKLGGHIFCADLLPPRSRASPFKQIVGQKLHMGAQSGLAEALQNGIYLGRHTGFFCRYCRQTDGRQHHNRHHSPFHVISPGLTRRDAAGK
jgi:hypothetical protein